MGVAYLITGIADKMSLICRKHISVALTSSYLELRQFWP